MRGKWHQLGAADWPLNSCWEEVSLPHLTLVCVSLCVLSTEGIASRRAPGKP